MTSNLFDQGYDRNLTKAPPSFRALAQVASKVTSPVPPGLLGSGDLIGNLTMTDGFMQSGNFVTGVSGWQILPSGDVEFNDGVFRGSISASTIDIGGADATSFHVDIDGNMWLGAATFASGPFRVTNAGAATATSITITGGSVSGASIASIPNNTATDISLMECSHNLTFSVTDADTVAWSSGTIVFSNGRTFSISSGNTGNMAALTYIYLDPAVSSTVLQTTTTYSTAMGANKRLIGTAQNNTVTASFIPYGPGQMLVDGANIGALSIVAGNIAANTITAGKLSVSQLSAITADMGALTAGTITLSTTGHIKSGMSDYATGTGWWLGITSSTPKFSIGSASKYFRWDGTNADTTGIRIMETFTAGESVSSGNIGCIKPGYTDYTCTHDAYVDANGAFDDINYGTEVRLKTGTSGGSTFLAYIKWSTSAWPTPQNILRAEIILTVRQTFGTNGSTEILRVTSGDWDESTITYNTRPSTTDDIGAGQFGMEKTKTPGSATTTVTWDITNLARAWKDGFVSNYGIVVSYGGDEVDYNSKETLNGSDTFPIIRIYSTNASDGKVYKAKCSDFLFCRSIVGVIQETVSANASCLTQIAGSPTNLSSLQKGDPVFLDSTAGSYVSESTNLNRMIRLGKATGNSSMLLNIQDQDILIEKLYSATTATGAARRFYAPSDARYAIVSYNDGSNGTAGVIRINRDNDGMDSLVTASASNEVQHTWASNYLELDADFSASYMVAYYT